MRFCKSHSVLFIVISIACAVILTASTSVVADTHFGFGVSDGDLNLTWVENGVSVSDDVSTQSDNSRNEKEEDISLFDIDYDEYLRNVKLYMVFRSNF